MTNTKTTARKPGVLSPRRLVLTGPTAEAVRPALASALVKFGLDPVIEVMASLSSAGDIAKVAAADAVVLVAEAGRALAGELSRAALIARHLTPSPVRLATAGAIPPPAGGWAEHANALGSADPRTYALPGDADELAAALAADLADSAIAALPLRVWIIATERAKGHSVRALAQVASGQLTAGMDVVVLPEAAAARISAVEATVNPGIVHVTLDMAGDHPLEAGVLLSGRSTRPELADQVAAEIVWTGAKPLLAGRPYTLRLGPQSTPVQISTLRHRVHPDTLEALAARRLEAVEVGHCNVSFARPLLFDGARQNQRLSRFAIIDNESSTTVGYGSIGFTLRRATNIHWQSQAVNKLERARLKGQSPCCLWFTGLSGSGKSTVSSLLEKRLSALSRHTYTLDGDNVRHGLNRDLGFTDADRVENIRRVGEVAKLFVDAGLIVAVSFISPFQAERRMARELFPAGEFIEIFVDTPLAVCEQRDVKGLYGKARRGELKNFTGIDSPYEPPENPEIRLVGGSMPVEDLVEQVFRELERRGIV